MTRRINLIVAEGALEIPVALKLLRALKISTADAVTINKGGRIAFWKDARRYNQAAAHLGPVLGLADLEGAPCARVLFRKHLPHGKHRNFILRLAKPMLESWLLADTRSLATYLGVPEHLFPADPDSIPHPKKFLVQVAARSRSRIIRDDLVPKAGSLGVVGPRYTPVMTKYIETAWRPMTAKLRSPTLNRAIATTERAFT